MKQYDLAVIGAGPGGYVSAIYASRCGLKVCLIEKELLGGTCLNKGCIPTKAVLASAKALSAVRSAKDYGVYVPEFKLDFAQVQKRKDDIVKKQRSGIESLIKARHIDYISGQASFIDKNALKVNDSPIKANHIIIATGSSPIELPFARFNSTSILSSDDILSISSMPKDLVIIGAGVLGCEFAVIYNRFGTNVKIIEMMPQILPGIDADLAKRLEITLKARGIDIMTQSRVEGIEHKDGGLLFKTTKGDMRADLSLVSVGRRPNIAGLGAENIGIKIENNKIVVDDYLKTAVCNIYAVGDVTGGYMLAHTASHDGILAVMNLMGAGRKRDLSCVPQCIYTDPEIALVGLSSDDAKTRGLDVKSVKVPYTAIGRAHTDGHTEGFIKIICDNKTNKVLGAQIIGLDATNMISEAVLAVKLGITADELADTIHAHPTLPEGVMEAAYMFLGKGLHVL